MFDTLMSILPKPTILNIFLAVLTWTVIQIVYRLIIKPYFLCKYYEKQGFKMYYYPIMGIRQYFKRNIDQDSDCWSFLRKEVKANPTGKGVVVNAGEEPWVILYDPRHIQAFYNLSPDLVVKNPQIIATVQRLLGKGFTFAEGDAHKRIRKILSAVFHFEYLKESIPSIVEFCNQQLDEMIDENNLQGKPDGARVHLFKYLGSYAKGTTFKLFAGDRFMHAKVRGIPLWKIIFDTKYEAYQQAFTGAYLFFGDLGNLALRVGVTPYGRRLNKKIKEIRESVKGVVVERKALKKESPDHPESQRKDMLNTLLDMTSSGEDALNDDEIVDNFLAFYTAGMLPAPRSVESFVYEVVTHPEIERKLVNEINEHIKSNEDMTLDNINKMEYLNAVWKEILRLKSPGAVLFPRLAKKTFNVAGSTVRKGATISPSPMLAANNPLYFDKPEEFRPERWFETDSKLKSEPFAYMPFATGARNCMGQHLATYEGKIMIILLFKRLSIQLREEKAPRYHMLSAYSPVDPLHFHVINKA